MLDWAAMASRRITAGSLILLLAGCGILNPGRNALSFAQYNSLSKGMPSSAITKAFGRPADILEKDGKVRGLSYRCEDGNGDVVGLKMVFDAQGLLEHWALRPT